MFVIHKGGLLGIMAMAMMERAIAGAAPPAPTPQVIDGETFKASQLKNIEVVRKVIEAKYK